MSYRDALLIRLSGEAVRFLTFTGPFLAEPTKAWLLKRRGLTVIEGFAATGTEYVAYTSLSAVMALGVVSYLLFRSDLGPEIAGLSLVLPTAFVAVATAAFVDLVRGGSPMTRATRMLVRMPPLRSRWQPNLESILAFERRLQSAMRERPAAVVGILAVEVAAQGLLVAEAYWILRALDLAPAWQVPLIIEGGAKVNAAFFIIPGQVGTAEAMYAAMFTALGLSAIAGFTMAFVRRLRTLFVAALGLVALAVLLRKPSMDGTGPVRLVDLASAHADATAPSTDAAEAAERARVAAHVRATHDRATSRSLP